MTLPDGNLARQMLAIVTLAGILGVTPVAAGEMPLVASGKGEGSVAASPPQEPSARGLSMAELSPAFQVLVTQIVRDNLPAEYADTRHWGMTRERWDGLHVHREGWEIHTKRKRKTVNHGTWKRFHLRQIDPQQNVHVHIGPARTLEDGRAAFVVTLDAKVHTTAQIVEWNRGVRLWSVTVEAVADVRLWADLRLATQLDVTRLPPDILLRPEVVDGDLQLQRFEVERISHLDGAVARELGGILERMVRDKIDDKRPSLIAKVNRQIAKHQDELRLSARDAVRESWADWLGRIPRP